MSVESARPAVCDLICQLYGRPVRPELFDILAVRKLRPQDYQLTVWITRTGHVISWENNDVLLTEITAAAYQELPQRRRLLHYKLRHEHTGQLTCAHGIHYQMRFQVEVLQPEIFVHVHDEILSDSSKRGLLHNFPVQHRLAIAPLGFVSAEARPGCLFLASLHTFPDA